MKDVLFGLTAMLSLQRATNYPIWFDDDIEFSMNVRHVLHALGFWSLLVTHYFKHGVEKRWCCDD
jgi:hypothetical protein